MKIILYKCQNKGIYRLERKFWVNSYPWCVPTFQVVTGINYSNYTPDIKSRNTFYESEGDLAKMAKIVAETKGTTFKREKISPILYKGHDKKWSIKFYHKIGHKKYMFYDTIDECKDSILLNECEWRPIND